MSSHGAVLAHGIAVRHDLPIPYSYALVGAALALIVSFVALGTLWRRPRLEDRTGGRPLSAWLARGLDAPIFRWTLRIIGLVATVFAVSTALLGPDEPRNPFAGTVYVLFWIGVLVLASALFGPVWRALNPLRTLHLMLVRATGGDERDGLLRYPTWLGCWPAAATLLSFAWLELVARNRASTGVLLSYFALYSGVMLVGAALFGSRWFDGADGFEKYSTVIGHLSPIGRRATDRVAVLRNPLTNLTAVRTEIGLPAFVSVMLGVTAFDAFSNSTRFIRWSQQGTLSPQVAGTIGLVGTVLVVFVTFGIASGLAGVLGGRPAHLMPRTFAHSLVPIALGYVVAHYYSFFLIGGQQTIALYSDPYQTGANYLGIAHRDASFAIITPTAVAVIQVVAVVLGHVLGVISAHDRAVDRFPRKHAIAGQLPLLIVMVAYTITGLSLLFEF